MSRRHRSAVFQILLIASLLFSSSSLKGQSTETRPPSQARYYPEPQPPAPVQSLDQEPSIRKFTFKHAKAADVLKILHQLAGHTDHIGLKIAVDERTNSLVFQPDDDRKTREFEETCALLDAESPSSSVTGPGASVSIPALGPKPLTFDLSFPIVSDNSIETLQKRYNELEQQAHQLADILKQSKSLSETERKELQTSVRKSFEARQAMQRAELANLAQRMQKMQRSIDMRDKLADKIVERRVEDLLNPNLKWDVPEPTALSKGEYSLKASSIKENAIGFASAIELQQLLQGEWQVKLCQVNEGVFGGQDCQVVIRGNVLLLQTFVNGQVIGAYPYKLVWPDSDHPFEVDVIRDPNANKVAAPGRIACDHNSFQIVFGGPKNVDGSISRPSEVCPVENAVYIDCVRDMVDHRPASIVPPKTAELSEADLSTPQATLDYIHRYSLAHPGDFPAECYTDGALLELSGMMLQNLTMMSAISQMALQTGGVIGKNDGVPVVSSVSPAFHIQVEALLKEQIWTTPIESSNQAFELLTKLTFGSKSNNAASMVHADRQLICMAAGVLKSPKEFLPAASKLLTAFGQNDADVTKSKEADQTQPKADIAINGDEATATFIISNNHASSSQQAAPRITKLRRIDGRWLISEILSDEEISQMQSSYSEVMDLFGGSEKAKSDKSKTSNTEPPEWNDFLKVLPETGTALVMFSYEPEIKEQMLPVAKKVAEAASAQLIELPQTTWHKIIAPPATHFVLMKDRQLVGTRTGLMTETRLQDFVGKAKDWLTPRSIGIDENSLVRIDCYINPGRGNAGSQHGGPFPMTTAVVAVHEDQALLLGPDRLRNQEAYRWLSLPESFQVPSRFRFDWICVDMQARRSGLSCIDIAR